MGLLTVCAKHYEGLFWLAMFYVVLTCQPSLADFWDTYASSKG